MIKEDLDSEIEYVSSVLSTVESCKTFEGYYNNSVKCKIDILVAFVKEYLAVLLEWKRGCFESKED